MAEGNGFWKKLGLAFLPFLIAAAVAFVTLKADVRHVEESLQTKANRETVQAQYESIVRELQQINNSLERIDRKVAR